MDTLYSDPKVAATRGDKEQFLAKIRRWGMFGYTDVPTDQKEDCVVHLWARPSQPPERFAVLIGHELGHIADGGPYLNLGHKGEEERADEYARTAQEAALLLLKLGRVSPRRARAR